MDGSMKRLAALISFLFLASTTMAFDYSFTEVNFKVDGSGGFTLNALFNVLPDANLTRMYLIGANKNLFVTYSTAPVYFDEKGYFIYLNESGNVSIKGRIDFARSTKITFPSPIMRLKITTPTYSDEFYSVIGKEVTLYKYETQPEEQRITPTYNLFIDRHSSDFTYVLDLSVVTQEVTLTLYNNEIIDSVTGVERYRVSGNQLVLYPNQNRIKIYGSFPSNLTYFKPGLPLPGYVTIQYPSELEVTVTTNAKQIDESKVPGIEIRYPNRLSYEVYPTQTFSIKFSKLETFPSLVFAVNQVNNKVSISENGVILQNTQISFDNTGVDYVSLYVSDLEPLYAGLNGGSTLITKKGKDIYLAVPKKNYQNIELITLDKKPELGLGSWVELEVPRIDYPITTFSNTIYYPDNYRLVYSTEGIKVSWEYLVFVLAVLTGLFYIVMPGKGRRRVLLAFITTLALISLVKASNIFVFFGIVAYGYALARKYKEHVMKGKKLLAILALSIGALIVIIIILMVLGNFIFGAIGFVQYDSPAEGAKIARAPLAQEMGVEKIQPTAEIGLVTKPEILPVRLSLPTYSNRVTITSKMVTKDKPLHVGILLVQDWVVRLAWLIVGILLLGAVRYKARK